MEKKRIQRTGKTESQKIKIGDITTLKIDKMKVGSSCRDLEIIHLIVSEYTTAEIANKLHLSRETIKTHKKNLRDKLQVRNVAGLVRCAYELNILSNPGIRSFEITQPSK